MYLANNIHPALVLIDLMRKADSTWTAWQVLRELILSALPPSPPVQINVWSFLLVLMWVTQLGTPHMHTHSHSQRQISRPRHPEVGCPTEPVGSQACPLLTDFLACREFRVSGQELYQRRMPALFLLLCTRLMWQRGSLSWTSIKEGKKGKKRNSVPPAPPTFTRQEGCRLTNNLLVPYLLEELISGIWMNTFNTFLW